MVQPRRNLTLALWQFSKLLILYAYKTLICSLFSKLRILFIEMIAKSLSLWFINQIVVFGFL